MAKPQHIKLEEGRSSVIREVLYDPLCQFLYVVFHSNGAVYCYKRVNAELFQELVRADSMGRFFTRKIKPDHDAEPIDKDEWENFIDWARALSRDEIDAVFREKNDAWLKKLRNNPLALRF